MSQPFNNLDRLLKLRLLDDGVVTNGLEDGF